VTTSQTLGQLDADTGFAGNQGPGRLRFMTIAVQHNFSKGSLLATFSKADARDLESGLPTPEAPRTISMCWVRSQQLPFHLQAKGEFRIYSAKPLARAACPDPNAECYGVAVKEFRAAVVRRS